LSLSDRVHGAATFGLERLTHCVTRGAAGRDACDSKRRDRTNRRVDAVVSRSPAITRARTRHVRRPPEPLRSTCPADAPAHLPRDRRTTTRCKRPFLRLHQAVRSATSSVVHLEGIPFLALRCLGNVQQESLARRRGCESRAKSHGCRDCTAKQRPMPSRVGRPGWKAPGRHQLHAHVPWWDMSHFSFRATNSL
jgi:hypothetical protein